MNEERAKSFDFSMEEVMKSYQRVKRKDGSSGIDEETIKEFEKNLQGNLYKIWNRLSSGSYIPPMVKEVMIQKKQGGERSLGIPTVSDRIAQGVVKNRLELILEPLFHENSYGYRTGKSAHDAIRVCRNNCQKYPWVIDLDIKGFFDNLNHEWMLKMVNHHTTQKSIMLYVERWLKASMQREDGTIVKRDKGTPQGGVISPLLANLYLHQVFDLWMVKFHKDKPFERYADDIIIHCNSLEEAKSLLDSILHRLQKFYLDVHPIKTKIVYCKNDRRKGSYINESFTFLGFGFQPRVLLYKNMKGRFVKFEAAISNESKIAIRTKIREIFKTNWTNLDSNAVSKIFNSTVRGWVNYYGLFSTSEMNAIFDYLDNIIRKWIRRKFKVGIWKSIYLLKELKIKSNSLLFYHWKFNYYTYC